MKYVTLDEGLEELWVRKEWDSNVAIMRGMNARQRSVGSHDPQYYTNQDEARSREDDLQRKHQNDLLLERCDPGFLRNGAKVYTRREGRVLDIPPPPPLHAWRGEEAYAMLEDSITYKGREIRNLKVIGIAGMMTEAILHSINRLWLCVWDVCYIIFCYLLHIQSGKTGNLFSLLLCSLWWVQIIRYVLSWRSYSLVCTLHNLIIIIVQTYLKTLIL